MKPNPCKWCGATARNINGYYCPNLACEKNGKTGVDFATWQKNNPIGWHKYSTGADWPDFTNDVITDRDGVLNPNSENFGIRYTRKSIRHSLKSLKADLLQLACEAGCKDRAWGEQIDKMADDVRELIEKI